MIDNDGVPRDHGGVRKAAAWTSPCVFGNDMGGGRPQPSLRWLRPLSRGFFLALEAVARSGRAAVRTPGTSSAMERAKKLRAKSGLSEGALNGPAVRSADASKVRSREDATETSLSTAHSEDRRDVGRAGQASGTVARCPWLYEDKVRGGAFEVFVGSCCLWTLPADARLGGLFSQLVAQLNQVSESSGGSFRLAPEDIQWARLREWDVTMFGLSPGLQLPTLSARAGLE